MKKEKFLLTVLTVLTVVFFAIFILDKVKENRNAPVLQKFDDAYITITAPPMKKSIQNEHLAKNTLNNKIHEASFYKAKYKKIEYAIVYAKYHREVNLKSGAESIVSTFKDNNFIYETMDNKIKGNKGMLLEGTYELNGVKYAIKEQLIKKTNTFWQVIVIFPYSEKNNALAQNYINSINIICD
ncbi:MAG: hypothetical protein LBN01_00660 [Endomicrobium sp.]|jgi:hypothetical protein|nr:hypothetical protein [Endomicrobium sp.]